ncbi:BTAD domain-containing putative transcriptional regulator [Streptomyces kebangsaanensis]|uniref:BTAD domain-containing putative transcriptional regulator n=1 Tax=Streptomyces kebangsaanensis TaxID=864058 RepID=A0ABW6L0C2_9ACTN
MADEVYLRLLGGFAVAVGDRPVATGAWRLRKARSPLKPLCPAPGHRMHREKLYGLLRPDLDGTAASNNLHQVLHAARRALASAGTPGDVVTLRDDLVLLGHDGGVRIDVDELDVAVRRAARDDTEPAHRAALDLAEAGPLPEDPYEPWAGEAATAPEARPATLGLGLAEALRRADRPAGAVDVLRMPIAEDPLHEPGHRALIRALADTGRRRPPTSVCGTTSAVTPAPTPTRRRAASTACCRPTRACFESSAVRPEGGRRGVWCGASQGGGSSAYWVYADDPDNAARRRAWGHLPAARLGERRGAGGTFETRPGSSRGGGSRTRHGTIRRHRRPASSAVTARPPGWRACSGAAGC